MGEKEEEIKLDYKPAKGAREGLKKKKKRRVRRRKGDGRLGRNRESRRWKTREVCLLSTSGALTRSGHLVGPRPASLQVQSTHNVRDVMSRS